MATEVYEDHGVRFEYPSDWTVEVTDEDEVTTVDLQHPEGVAFVLVRIDESCSDPERNLRSGPGGDARGVSRAGCFSRDGDARRARRHRPRRRVLLARCAPTRPASAASAPRVARCSFSASGRILAAKSVPDLVRGVFRSLEEMED